MEISAVLIQHNIVDRRWSKILTLTLKYSAESLSRTKTIWF